MSLRVLYFASLRDLTGTHEDAFDVAPTDDVADLWREATRRHPRLAEFRTRPMVACDRAYAGWDRRLDGVEEVAFLPPVSGG